MIFRMLPFNFPFACPQEEIVLLILIATPSLSFHAGRSGLEPEASRTKALRSAN